jgi:hypothetical protein
VYVYVCVCMYVQFWVALLSSVYLHYSLEKI